MEIRKEELQKFLEEKKLRELLNEKNVGIIMVNSKKINHNSEIEIFPMIIEKKGKFYIIYNCFFKIEIIIYNNLKNIKIFNKNELNFSVSKNLKVSEFEKNLKEKFSKKTIIYIR